MLELPVPGRSDVLKRLPGDLLRCARGERGSFNHDLWDLFRSASIQARVDAHLVVDRATYPFRDTRVFPAQSDLGDFGAWIDFRQPERAGHTGGAGLIEPEAGSIVCQPFHLLPYGRIDSHAMRRPSVRTLARARVRSEVQDLPEVLSLRDGGERNYYHCLHDLMGGRLRLAEEAGMGHEVPVVVGGWLHAQPFFRELMATPLLAGRRVMVQDHRLVRSSRLWFVDMPRHSLDSITYVQDALAVPPGDPHARRRLFVVRERRYGRGISNLDEVLEVTGAFGFETVATGDMTLAKQIELFSSTRHLVAASGTALTNMMWRRHAPMSVLEVYPPMVVQPRTHFFYLAAALGFRHYVLLGPESERGGPLDYRADFRIDPGALRVAIRRMLDEA